MNEYSSRQISKKLLDEIIQAVQSVPNYGSIEIFVQNGIVSQITVRTIKKTGNHDTIGSGNLNTQKRNLNIRI